jgi:hypothetical protein
MDHQMLNEGWAYDFACTRPIEAILAAFNAAGPWQWQQVHSDFCGDYVRCRPTERARVRVYERSQFRAWQAGDREGFYAEFESDPEGRSEIDQVFRRLLQLINATNITET